MAAAAADDLRRRDLRSRAVSPPRCSAPRSRRSPWASAFGLPIDDRRAPHRADQPVRGQQVRVGPRAAAQPAALAVAGQPAASRAGASRSRRSRRGCSRPIDDACAVRRRRRGRAWSATSCRSGWCTRTVAGASRSPRPAQAPLRAVEHHDASSGDGDGFVEVDYQEPAADLLGAVHRPGSRVMRRRLRRVAAVALAARRSSRSPAAPSDPLAEQYRERQRQELHLRRRHASPRSPPTNRGDAGRLRRARPTTGDAGLERRLRRQGAGASTSGTPSCAPCRAEAPTSRSPIRSYRRARSRFLGVNIYDQPDTARSLRETHGITYPSIIDVDAGAVQLAFAGNDAAERRADHPRARQQGRVAARILGETRSASHPRHRLVDDPSPRSTE